MSEYHYKCTLCLSMFVLLLVIGMGLDSYARHEMSQAQAYGQTGQRANLHAKRISISSLEGDTSGESGVIFLPREYVKVLR
ncbi:hypothetical protein [Paenibacillus massiliensis]|uniref:hypothetical protein n=1 Tax=Paenibacillus massiliensis TaxID=225917 RepID=UPI0004704D17|nr:hypothetical protein [Paenibacillus massiliensis]